MKTHVKYFFYSSMAVIIGLCGHLYECSISRGLENGMGLAGSDQTCGLRSPDLSSPEGPDLHTGDGSVGKLAASTLTSQ